MSGNYIEFPSQWRKPHNFMFNRFVTTSKTKMLPRVENGKKIAFKDFLLPSATSSEMNASSCSVQGIKFVSSCQQAGLQIVQTTIDPKELSLIQMKKLQLWLHVQARDNRSQGVKEHYTILG